jgi:hypothetical protein
MVSNAGISQDDLRNLSPAPPPFSRQLVGDKKTGALNVPMSGIRLFSPTEAPNEGRECFHFCGGGDRERRQQFEAVSLRFPEEGRLEEVSTP